MKEKTVVAIIQAHMSSSRLPGKILKDLCGKPALYRMIERVRQSKRISRIVLATSTMECDDILEELCREWGVDCFRGSDDDVLMRFVGAAKAFPSEYYARLTSDCPLIAPRETDEMIEAFLSKNARYGRYEQDNYINGTDVEVFTAELLMEAAEKAIEKYEHEHVTPYMYWKQDSQMTHVQWKDGKRYRITLDTAEDLELIRSVYNALYTEGNTFTLKEIIDFLDTHPEVFALNKDVHQKSAKE